LSKDPPNGRNVGVVDWRVTLDSIEELTIQYTGNAQTRARSRVRTVNRARPILLRVIRIPPSSALRT
jgi:hypothetical protein